MVLYCYHEIHKDQEVQGFLNYNSCADLENIVAYNVSKVLEDNDIIYNNEIEYLCIYAHGSRVFGNPGKNSDIDFVLFYKGSIREDDLFNIFVNEQIFIEHVKCDFNPIQIDDDSDIEYYIQKHDIEYHQKPVLEKKINLALALDDFDDNELIGQQTQTIKDTHYTKDYLDLINDYVVDLGLPSGTLWCKYNLGCNYDKLNNYSNTTTHEDWYGDYYAWGKVKTQKVFREGTYKLSYNLPELIPEYDAAYQNMHYKNYRFHMPTKEQFEELKEYTNNKQVNRYKDINALYGIELTSKINGNKLFLPASGFDGNAWKCTFGGFWSATEEPKFKNGAYSLTFNLTINPYSFKIDSSYKYAGFCIRPVLNL